MKSSIVYAVESDLGAAEFVDVLVRSTLSERRPVADRDRIGRMLSNASLVLTARTTEGLLIGVSRAITDYSYCTYLSDLAVDVAYQRRGIGQDLIRRTHEAAGLETSLVLLSAPNAETYYPHIGMLQHKSCWVTPRQS